MPEREPPSRVPVALADAGGEQAGLVQQPHRRSVDLPVVIVDDRVGLVLRVLQRPRLDLMLRARGRVVGSGSGLLHGEKVIGHAVSSRDETYIIWLCADKTVSCRAAPPVSRARTRRGCLGRRSVPPP